MEIYIYIVLQGDWNYYSAHPVYMNLENDGNANMVLLKNSNAMGMDQYFILIIEFL